MTQRQKSHTDDVNQCLHNISGSHGFHIQIFQFYVSPSRFYISVVFICKQALANSNASSKEEYFPPILTVLLEIRRVYI